MISASLKIKKHLIIFFECFDTEKIVNTPSDPKSILISFNKFFRTLGKNLADDIPLSDTIQHFSSYLPNDVSDSIFLKSPGSTEISNVILSLNTNKTVGCCCCSAYLSSCHWTASDANLLDDPHTFHNRTTS